MVPGPLGIGHTASLTLALMVSAEFRVAARHPLIIARHPGWWWPYLTGGRERVMTRVVKEDLALARLQPNAADLPEISHRPPITTLGRVGSPQEYLYYLVRWLKPRVVVETGVDRGLSSAFILSAIRDNSQGRLFSIDLPTASYFEPSARTPTTSNVGNKTYPGYVIPETLKSAWSLRLGDSRTALPGLLNELGTIDMFLHDSEHTYDLMRGEYAQAIGHLLPGGILASDDVNWNPAFQDTVRDGQFDFSAIILGRLGIARYRGENRDKI